MHKEFGGCRHSFRSGMRGASYSFWVQCLWTSLLIIPCCRLAIAKKQISTISPFSTQAEPWSRHSFNASVCSCWASTYYSVV